MAKSQDRRGDGKVFRKSREFAGGDFPALPGKCPDLDTTGTLYCRPRLGYGH